MSRPDAPIDPDIDRILATNVRNGQFSSIEEARADFWARLDESIAQANRGELHDIEVVWARMREKLTSLPHAAE